MIDGCSLFLQTLHNRYSRSLDTILRDRLTETPTMEKLQHLLEVFGELFTEEQKRSFLQAGLLAIHHHLLHVSQAGLVLTYSILGEAGQLLEDEPRSRPSIHPLQLCLLLLLIFPNPSDFDYMASTFAWIWTLARTSDHPASTSGLDMDTDSGSAWTYSAPGSSRQAPPLIKP
ncbi:uncharacterized protein LOC120398053 isoform X3 [Mauremys reevesii]|uniref:uncharacterized protein LOC120398053 isoform X3 n=1 Tax=Mauremys reevesii TaxID=260615 RepID=UPI00193F93AB|nr:uncharacterized protein LOC120398053 isoform X3 [Mauremys reevesii]